MYNGIGLNTPRGTGTNGYVQKNISYLRPRHHGPAASAPPMDLLGDKDDFGFGKRSQPNAEILEHAKKRQVEVQCLELQERLEEDAKYDEVTILEKVDALRKRLLADYERKRVDELKG